jgi:hypothetical protein
MVELQRTYMTDERSLLTGDWSNRCQNKLLLEQFLAVKYKKKSAFEDPTHAVLQRPLKFHFANK